ncbi:hypothetical protein L0F63_007185 [Massospora cicadina]|nr:hypothetical protein L0F63_007185 [Massospora cicadina]
MAHVYIHLVSTFVALGGFLLGYDTGAISGTIVTPEFLIRFAPVTSLVQGAIVSSLMAGCFLGSLVSGWVSDGLGRKASIVIASGVVLVGSLIQALSFSLLTLYTGRVLAGLGIGQLAHAVPLYQAEISPPNIRGRLISFYQLAASFGLAVSFWVSYAFQGIDGEGSFRVPLSLQALPALVLAVGCFLLPPSPRWLIEKGRIQESLLVFAKVWESEGLTSVELISEFNAIKTAVDAQRSAGLSELLQPSTYRRLSLGLLLLFYQQMTGIGSVTYFAPLLFQQLGVESVSSLLIDQGITGIVAVVFSILSLALSDSWGRKKVLVLGALLMAVSMGAIAVGWIYPAEIFNQKVRSVALATIISFYWLFKFAISLLTPILLHSVGWRLYALFSAFGLIMAISVLLSFPETKKRGLDEMDLVFSGLPNVRVPRLSRTSLDSD